MCIYRVQRNDFFNGCTQYVLSVSRLSQCSTVLRNTVVKATIKINGKHPILGTRSPKTFDRSTWNLTGVIMSAVWPHMPKMVKIGRVGPPRHRGEISCSNVFLPFLYFFLTSCAPLESTFFTVSPAFLRQTTCFGGDWFPRGSQLRHLNFSPSKPQKSQFSGLRKFSAINTL